MLRREKDQYARGSIKELRSVLKKSEKEVAYYLKFHKLESLVMESYQGIFTEPDISRLLTGEKLEGKLFLKTADGAERSILFDAIELMDAYIEIG